jgi:hypothetical protein
MLDHLYATLHPPVTLSSDRYSVEYGGEIIVVSSRTAEMDAARVLLKRGITGLLTFLDAKTGKPRISVDIEKAAKLTIREDNRGMGFAPWKPFPTTAVRPRTAEEPPVVPTMPEAPEEAA